jgi:hypothetical protein
MNEILKMHNDQILTLEIKRNSPIASVLFSKSRTVTFADISGISDTWPETVIIATGGEIMGGTAEFGGVVSLSPPPQPQSVRIAKVILNNLVVIIIKSPAYELRCRR